MTNIKPFSPNVLQQNRTQKPKAPAFGWKGFVEVPCGCGKKPLILSAELTAEKAGKAIKRALDNIKRIATKPAEPGIDGSNKSIELLSSEEGSWICEKETKWGWEDGQPLPIHSHTKTGLTIEDGAVRYTEGFAHDEPTAKEIFSSAGKTHRNCGGIMERSVGRHYTLKPENPEERTILADMRKAVKELHRSRLEREQAAKQARQDAEQAKEEARKKRLNKLV